MVAFRLRPDDESIMTTLLITDGDQTADLLAAAGSRAIILPWRDVLHDGPLPALETLEATSAVRGAHLAQRFNLDAATSVASLAERDAVMRRHAEFDRIELWFEHNLYDQLQLVQILDYFASEQRTNGIVLVQADSFFSQELPDTVMRFAIDGVRIGPSHLRTAAAVWSELTDATPERIAHRATKPVKGLPFLQPALSRFLDELPQPETGLARTETRLLDLLSMDTLSPSALFRIGREAEDVPFMGTWPFYTTVDSLAFCDYPLLSGLSAPYSHADADIHAEYVTAPLAITDIGEDVLSGVQDHVATNGVDRWWGGTKLEGFTSWRFDRATRTVLEPR
jgi:hypothetical protein